MYNFFSKRLNGNRKGFTLVELLVVMAILAVLIAIAVMNMGNTTVSAKVSRHNTQVREVFSAATMWYANNAANVTTDRTLTDAELKNFFNGGAIPKAEFAATGGVPTETDFEVKVTATGQVKVKPGLMMVDDATPGAAKPDTANNAKLQGN